MRGLAPCCKRIPLLVEFDGYVIVDLYIKFTLAELARKVFDVVLQRDTVLWNTENPMSIEVKLKHK